MEYGRYLISGKNASSFPDLLEEELKDEQFYLHSSSKESVKLFVIEKYSFLQNSDKSLTVMTEVLGKDKCEVNAIVSGGKTSLLRIDLFFTEAGLLSDFEDFMEQMAEYHDWVVKVFKEEE